MTRITAVPSINSSSVTSGNRFRICSIIHPIIGIFKFSFTSVENGVVKISIILENVGKTVSVHRFIKNSKFTILATAKESDHCEGKENS